MTGGLSRTVSVIGAVELDPLMLVAVTM